MRGLLLLALLLCGCAPQALPEPSEPGYGAARFQPGYAEVNAVTPTPPTPREQTRGAELYVNNCASCHGAEGRGDGSISRSLNPKPRDLRRVAEYKYGTGERAVFRTIKYGVDGTGMGPWGGRMTDEEMWSLTRFVRGLQGS